VSGDPSGPERPAAGEDAEQRDGGGGVAAGGPLGAGPPLGPGQAPPAPVLHVLQVTMTRHIHGVVITRRRLWSNHR